MGNYSANISTVYQTAAVQYREEEDIGSLRLLITVGQAMDNECARDHMNIYFTRMAEFVKNTNFFRESRDLILFITR